MSTQQGSGIAIIVPVHRGGVRFEQCLESLRAASPPPDELIVVADGDREDDRRTAERFGARVLSTPSPGGPARARNLGAAEARAEILFFVDADVTLARRAVDRVAGVFRGDPTLAALFGAYDDDPAAPNFLSQYKNLLHHYVHTTSSEDAATFWAACGAIRRQVFLDLHGFDESYRQPMIEDIELGYRLRRAGHRIRLVKDLHVKHLKRWTVGSLLRADFFGRALPWTRLILGGERFIDDLNLNLRSRLSVVAVFLLLATLAGGLLEPRVLLAAIPLMAALVWLNRDLYRFFRSKRGTGFALMTIPWHWFYFFYSGLAFLIGLSRHGVERLVRGRRRAPA